MFWHRLTLAIGGCTVEELQQRMTRREFEAWNAFDLIDPIGAKGDTLRMAYMLGPLTHAMYGDFEWSQLIPEFLLPYEVEERRRNQAHAKSMMLKAYLMGKSAHNEQ